MPQCYKRLEGISKYFLSFSGLFRVCFVVFLAHTEVSMSCEERPCLPDRQGRLVACTKNTSKKA
jgi:hypothetical protein